jgi:ligand-binding SRPBCC domain-containing protein
MAVKAEALYFGQQDVAAAHISEHCSESGGLNLGPLSMRSYYLEREQWLPQSRDKIFSFFSRPENLQKLTPPWLDFRMVDVPEELAPGALIRYRLRWHLLPIRWTTEISQWDPPHTFVDRALSGPYALWHHEHSFESRNGGTIVRDHVTYALPFGWFGVLAHRLRVGRDIQRIFDYRTRKLLELFPG